MGVRQERKKRESAAKKRVAIALLSAVLVAGGGFFAYFLYNRHQVKELLAQSGIYQNITISGIDMSGKTPEEALAVLQQAYPQEEYVLTFFYDTQTWDVNFTELDAGYHLEQAVEQAYQTGRNGSEQENFAVGKTLLNEIIDIPLEFSYDTQKLTEKVAAIATEFDKEPINSTVSRKNGSFVVTPEQDGRVMNQPTTIENAKAVLDTHQSGTAAISAEVSPATVTAEQNSYVKDLIGTYTTTYNNSDPNRNTNLKVGSNYINGTVIAPGEVFSANVELGPQTYEGGYKDAAVYNNGKVEQGIAGGVCQITSTLYNAAILAELEIVERSPHSMTVGYVPLGRDAAIAGDYKDLKFRNNTDYPILIEAYASGGNLVMNIYGYEEHDPSRKVSFETVYEATIPKPDEVITEDPELPEGERVVTSTGKTGSKVSVYKIVTENGAQVSKEWFSSSSYRATADYVTVGTKKAQEASTTTQSTTNETAAESDTTQ